MFSFSIIPKDQIFLIFDLLSLKDILNFSHTERYLFSVYMKYNRTKILKSFYTKILNKELYCLKYRLSEIKLDIYFGNIVLTQSITVEAYRQDFIPWILDGIRHWDSYWYTSNLTYIRIAHISIKDIEILFDRLKDRNIFNINKVT